MRLGAWLRRWLLEPQYPMVAVEVRGRSVGVVRLARDKKRVSLAAAACLELPEGVVRPSMSEPNIADPAAFKAALGSALERAGVLNAGRVALVLPDPVARVSLVPASELRGRRAEAEELIRFRLRKSVPFEIRDARVGVVAGGPAGSPVLVGAIYRPVLESYEDACHALGLHPGLVELSGLALVSAEPAAAGADRLFVNWDDDYLSLVLTRGGWPLLIRTLVGEAASAPDQVVREAANTVLYYRERLGGAGLAGASVRSARVPPADAVAMLHEPLGLLPQALDPWAALGASANAESAQPLAGAAACAAARAA